MENARLAIATWLGTLARSGVLHSPPTSARGRQGDVVEAAALGTAGLAVAAYVVGEERLDDLRDWIAGQSTEDTATMQQAAVRTCIWMAHADRHVADEERRMLEAVVAATELDPAMRQALVATMDDPPALMSLAVPDHGILRELLLAMCWELAAADGRIASEEQQSYQRLAEHFQVPPMRAAAICDAVAAKVVV